jgi:hypothetical protein
MRQFTHVVEEQEFEDWVAEQEPPADEEGGQGSDGGGQEGDSASAGKATIQAAGKSEGGNG